MNFFTTHTVSQHIYFSLRHKTWFSLPHTKCVQSGNFMGIHFQNFEVALWHLNMYQPGGNMSAKSLSSALCSATSVCHVLYCDHVAQNTVF